MLAEVAGRVLTRGLIAPDGVHERAAVDGIGQEEDSAVYSGRDCQ